MAIFQAVVKYSETLFKTFLEKVNSLVIKVTKPETVKLEDIIL